MCGSIGDPKQPLFAAASAVVQSVAARPQSSTSVSVTNLKTTEASRTNGLPRAAAGMLVFWVFVNALIASSVVAEDKQTGVLTRIASTPVSPSAVVVGDVLARFAICFVQALIVAGLSSLLFGATWGAVVPFTLLMAMLALTAAAASVLVGMMLRRPGPEAATAASAVAALLGIVGGCFWSLANAPTILQIAGRFTPQGVGAERDRRVGRARRRPRRHRGKSRDARRVRRRISRARNVAPPAYVAANGDGVMSVFRRDRVTLEGALEMFDLPRWTLYVFLGLPVIPADRGCRAR